MIKNSIRARWVRAVHRAAARRHMRHLREQPGDEQAWERCERHMLCVEHPRRSPHWQASAGLHYTPPWCSDCHSSHTGACPDEGPRLEPSFRITWTKGGRIRE